MYLERPHRRQPSLKPFLEYRESEKHCETRAACSRAGELLEYETLALRVVPPNIEIENSDTESVTRVTVDSANRPGTLVEVCPQHAGGILSGCLDLLPHHRTNFCMRRGSPLFVAQAALLCLLLQDTATSARRTTGSGAGCAAFYRAGPGDA